ncbi:MAG: porin family protein [Flavobacteriaceae bacterium]|nr:porin family protein [Flavobacteriaceae bacterium]
MKNLFLSMIALFTMSALNAQSGFGVNGGLLMGMGKSDYMGHSSSDSEAGFYVGVFKQFPLGEGFELQPALNAGLINDVFLLQIPVIFKYYVAEGFNIQAGPQLLFDFEDYPDDFTGFNFGIAAGLGYDFTEKFLAEIRYGLQVNNGYTGDADYSLKLNTLNLGVGYKF